jgi:hypothetical protein
MPTEQPPPDCNNKLYVLRLWREDERAPWRVALRDAASGAAVGFSDLDDLLIFLLHAMQASATPAPACDETP